jgi:hypothetical protein
LPKQFEAEPLILAPAQVNASEPLIAEAAKSSVRHSNGCHPCLRDMQIARDLVDARPSRRIIPTPLAAQLTERKF